MIGVLDKFGAILRRDLLTAIRYRTGFLFRWVGMLPDVIAFYYVAHAIGPNYRPDGVQYFPFLLVGTGVFGYSLGAMSRFVASIHDAQVGGTLELLATSSTPAAVVLTLTAVSCFVEQMVNMIVYIAIGLLLFRTAIPMPNVPAAVLILLLSMAIALAFGMMAASAQVAVQRGSWLIVMMGSFIALLTGTMFPVSALPPWVQTISRLIPFTHALTGLRLALLNGAPIRVLAAPILILAVYSLILLPASFALFSWVLRDARRKGTLSFY